MPIIRIYISDELLKEIKAKAKLFAPEMDVEEYIVRAIEHYIDCPIHRAGIRKAIERETERLRRKLRGDKNERD